MSTVAYINPKMLTWARERVGLVSSDDDLPKKFKQWETEKEAPTFAQAKAIAHQLRIPFGYLYLSTPPVEDPQIADFRTLAGHGGGQYSVDLKALLDELRLKQDWYREYLSQSESEPVHFVGAATTRMPVETLAGKISEVLLVGINNRGFSKDHFLAHLTNKVEEAGVLVIRKGHIGSNTRRALSIEEFRGLALVDRLAPIIFINTRDFLAPQIFTLLHEFVHIWLGQEGVSNPKLDVVGSNAMERYCNQVAAEVLVPQNYLSEVWARQEGNLSDRASAIAVDLKVSPVVVALRAYELGLIKQGEFSDYYAICLASWKKLKMRQEESAGGSFWSGFPVANSRKFVSEVCRAVLSERITVRDASRFLGISPDKVTLYARGGVGK